MNVVGFDVGKDSLFGARIDRSGVVKERYELSNKRAALLPVLKLLKKKYRHLLVASEATAEYHRPLAEACIELGIQFRLLNPITTKQFTRSTVRKRKTDKTDAEVIARVALQGEGTVITADSFRDTQPMLRTAGKLVQLSHMLRLMQHHMDAILPAETLLKDELAACQERLELAVKTFRGRATEETPQELEALLISIPGVGHVTAAVLIAEIGDITRFKDAQRLVAYAGLDPRVRQSGTSLNRNSHLTKRGSPYLRRALYLAAASAQRHDPELKATYDKKRAEGKRYSEATIVVARKVLARVYAVWKRNQAYEVRTELVA